MPIRRPYTPALSETKPLDDEPAVNKSDDGIWISASAHVKMIDAAS